MGVKVPETDVVNVNEALAVIVAVLDSDEPKLGGTDGDDVDVGVMDGDGNITSLRTACGGNTD